jgi:AcrR family transcriptional regulator
MDDMDDIAVGLRERKKERTRATIADAALNLFRERGFDTVTVAEVARAADVSEGTVFNYFPTKEDLFYGRMASFESALIEAVRGREPGESVLGAFSRFVLAGSTRLADPERARVIADSARIVGGSRALQHREREIVDRSTRELAALIASETGARESAIEPLVAATALMGTQRAIVATVHRRVLAGESGPRLASAVRAEGRRAFALLERGLGDYGVVPTRAAASERSGAA